MNQIKHIIWDWNGTILNDAWLCVEIINEMLLKRDKTPISEKFYSEAFDFPVKIYYERVGFDFQVETIENLSVEYMSIYEKRKYECQLHAYFNKLQCIIKKNNIKQSILSAYSENYLKDILLYHKMINKFSNVSGLSHILADSKIENGKILMKKLNIPKEKCIFIGDTIHDLDTAQAMGVKCWLYPSGHNSRKRLEARTDKIINQFSDITHAIMQ